MEPYFHVQRPSWIYAIATPLVVPLFIDVIRSAPAGLWIAEVPVLILGWIAAMVSSVLTTSVDGSEVSWCLGAGWPVSSIALADIDRVLLTRTNLFDGFGIHWTTFYGWRWKEWGFQAVEIFKKDGGRVTLGTDDPQGLFKAIERFRMGAAA